MLALKHNLVLTITEVWEKSFTEIAATTELLALSPSYTAFKLLGRAMIKEQQKMRRDILVTADRYAQAFKRTSI